MPSPRTEELRVRAAPPLPSAVAFRRCLKESPTPRHLNLDRLRHQAVPLEAAHRRESDIVVVPLLVEGNDNANAVGDMIDMSYSPGGALGCTFFPEALDVAAQFNGSALDRDADLR